MEVDRNRLADIELTDNALRRSQKALPQEEREGRGYRGAYRDVPAGRVEHRRGRVPLQGGRGGPEALRGVEGEVPPDDAHPEVHAELADPHERGQGAAAAQRVLRVAGRGLHRRHLRHPQAPGRHPQERRRHRLRLLALASQERPGQEHDGRLERAGLVHGHIRRFDGQDQAGRHQARGEHGHPQGGPPRRRGVHRLQARQRPDQQLQHLRRHHRRVHGGRRGRYGLRAQEPARRRGHEDRAGQGPVPQDRRGGVAQRRARGRLYRQDQRRQPDAAVPDRVDESVLARRTCRRTTRATWVRSTWSAST